jgi:hypothetical protein
MAKRTRTRKTNKKSKFLNQLGKSVTLVKNVAGTGANLALRVSVKTLKKANKTAKTLATRTARNANILGNQFITSAKNFLRKTLKKIH